MGLENNPLNRADRESDSDVEHFEIVDNSNAVQSITKAETDVQIATAKRYPRSIKKFMENATAMVTRDVVTAEGCFYRLERKDADGKPKPIEGPSVRLLEIAAACYGNIKYGARIIEEGERFIVAQGVAFDIENNVYSSTEVRRRITTKRGGRYGDDMIGVTANAACAIAKRNALNGVVPRVFVQELYEAAKRVAVGTEATLGDRRARALTFYKDKLGVSLDRILKKLQRDGIESITLDDLERLTGIKTAIKDGDTTVDQEFPVDNAPTGSVGGAAAENPLKTAAKKPEPVADPKPVPTAAPEAPVVSRDELVKELEDKMLVAGVSEKKLYSSAKKAGLVGAEDSDQLFDLPTATLAKINAAFNELK